MRLLGLLAILPIALVQGGAAQSIDLAVSGYGLSIGNSSRFSGIRMNAVDERVERVNGLNLTLWNPGTNPAAIYNGMTLGIIGTKARRIDGIALSGIGVNARDRLRGVAAGALGVGAGSLTGLAIGMIAVDIRERARGITLAGIWTGNDEQRLDGLAVSPGATMSRVVRGGLVGGVFAASTEGLTGLAISLGGVYGAPLRGLAVAGVGAGGTDIDGVAVSLGGIGGGTMDGVMLAGLGLGATERIRGVAIGGGLVFAPEVKGVAIGALNGLYIDRIDLEDFIHFKLANRRFTGLSVGLINYTAHLNGVQLGLLNYAGNNPRWLRLLPLINLNL